MHFFLSVLFEIASDFPSFDFSKYSGEHFYFIGDDYRYHIEVDAKRRFLELLKDRFNAGVRYKAKTWKWDTIILNKAQELARFLLGKTELLNFMKPEPPLMRIDRRELRKRIDESRFDLLMQKS